MKKLLSLILALAMLLGCVAFAEGVDYTGTWVVTGLVVEELGMKMGPNALQQAGMDATMTLNADGTAVLTFEGEAEDGAWVANENGVAITDASATTMNAVYQDEMLILEEAGQKMMFTREGAAPAIAEEEAPTILANVDPKEFEGQWLLTKANLMGMDFPAESLGLYMALMLSEGSGVFAGTNENGELVASEITYTVEEEEGVGTVMVVLVTNAETGETAVLMTLNKLSDGTLVYNYEEAGMVIAYVFSMVTEEAAE